MNRRNALKSMIAAASAFSAATVTRRGRAVQLSAENDDKPDRTKLGLVEYCLGIRRRALKQKDASADLAEPLTFLDVCHGMGAGGIQVNLGVRDEAYCDGLRWRAEQHGMHIEGVIRPPRKPSDVERFERQVRTAARVGVGAVRIVIIPGRRYEFFDSLEKFREVDARTSASAWN